MQNKVLKIDLGNTRGVARQLDECSRLTIPKDFKRDLSINIMDELEMFLLDDGIYIRKRKD